MTALRSIRARGDRVMMMVCWLLCGAGVSFAVLHGEWKVALSVGPALAIAATAMAKLYPGRLMTRLGMAVIFIGFAALLIHETHGLIETHFVIFALLAFLLYYRDWRPVCLNAGLVAVHHDAFCQMQMAGWQVYLFPAGHGCQMVWVHAAYVVMETIVLVYLSEAIRSEALETAAIQQFGESIVRTGVIDLRRGAVGALESAALERLLQALDGAIRQAGQVAHGISTVSAQVSEATREIVVGSSVQRSGRQRAVEMARRIAHTAVEVSGNCCEMATVARHSVSVVKDGRQTMQETVSTMEGLVCSATEVEAQARDLNTESQRMESLLKVMGDLASQTDLLALNAMIEAARAGESGRGFLVVAQEVGALSLRTRHSLQEAQLLVDRLRAQAQRVSLLASEAVAAAERGGTQVHTAAGRLDEAVGQLPRIAERADHVMEHGVTSSQLSDSVVRTIAEADPRDVAQSTNIEKIDRLRQSLEGMSADLCRSVEVFRTRAA